MNYSRSITSIFVVMAISIVATTAVLYYAGQKVIRMNHQVLIHRAAMGNLEEFISTLKDAETEQRGYIITGDPQYLDPHQDTFLNVRNALAHIQNLKMSDDSRKLMDSIATLTEEKLGELRKTVDIRKSQGFEAAQSVIKEDVGKNLMDLIRRKILQVKSEQEANLEDCLRSATAANAMRTAIYLGAAIINLYFLYWAYRRLRKEISDREEARAEANRQKDLLKVTLSSIGDCVMVTDSQGNVTFMNVIAEELTGWTVDEAMGKPITNVFRIINEDTRETVESPVEKVLRLGQIVGLANHTLLIRKDGTEVPIDDSGAPVREPDGTVRGVVLVFRDFTSYKNAEKELERAKETAENANRLKDQFLAMLSHELRTPLTPVLATFSIWDMNNSVPAELKSDVQMLRHSIELEARLIDDLLDLTRIVKGILHLTLEVENVHHLIESVVTMYTSDVHGKHLSLTTHLDALKHHANIDPARVQQIFGNLLKNATKFTPENGAIVITTGNDVEGNLTVTFTDNGIGISQATLQRLFLPFEQGEHKLSHRYEGLGLGLAISKSLVDALGGTITATSDGPGTGASMTVTFPTVAPSQQSTLMSMQGSDGTGDPKRSLKILLLEDHGYTSQVMSRLLKMQGYDVRAAASIEEAKEFVKEGKFDLLLCDLGLPDGTGMEFLREVRKFDQTPAIALSGFGMEEDIARCTEAGFNAHLTKPIDIQRLEAIIRQVTAKN